MSNAKHILTKDEFNKIYTEKRGFFYDLVARKPSRDEVNRQVEVEEAYIKLLQNGKDLFEDTIQEISQEEVNLLKQRKKKANRNWLIVVLCIGVPFSAIAILNPTPITPEDMPELVGLLFVAIGIFGYRYLMNRNYNAVLSCKEKRVLKGVVTNKHKVVLRKNDEEAGAFLELSLHMMVQVWPKDFKTVSVGDIVQIDSFSDDFGIKPNVAKRGVFRPE